MFFKFWYTGVHLVYHETCTSLLDLLLLLLLLYFEQNFGYATKFIEASCQLRPVFVWFLIFYIFSSYQTFPFLSWLTVTLWIHPVIITLHVSLFTLSSLFTLYHLPIIYLSVHEKYNITDKRSWGKINKLLRLHVCSPLEQPIGSYRVGASCYCRNKK